MSVGWNVGLTLKFGMFDVSPRFHPMSMEFEIISWKKCIVETISWYVPNHMHFVSFQSCLWDGKEISVPQIRFQTRLWQFRMNRCWPLRCYNDHLQLHKWLLRSLGTFINIFRGGGKISSGTVLYRVGGTSSAIVLKGIESSAAIRWKDVVWCGVVGCEMSGELVCQMCIRGVQHLTESTIFTK